MERKRDEPFGKTLLTSILGPERGDEGYYESRFKGKWVQLSNPDRARPKPAEGSNADRKTRRRDQRLVKRARQMETRNTHQRFTDSRDAGKANSNEPTTSKIADREGERDEDDGKPLSRRKRKQMGLEGKVDQHTSYESFLPIHQLWLSYMHRLLHLIELDGSPNVQLFSLSDDQSIFMQPHQVSAVQATLTKADLCGAPIVVSRASNPALVGLEGLTVQETEGTFVIVNRKNQIKTIPKQGSIFILQVKLPDTLVEALRKRSSTSSASPSGADTLQVPLFGNQLTNNVQTRATKKYKQRRTIDL